VSTFFVPIMKKISNVSLLYNIVLEQITPDMIVLTLVCKQKCCLLHRMER